MCTIRLDAIKLLESLQDAGFEFVVIGGVAALAHGATTQTTDLDVAAPMTPENLARLLTALAPYHPMHATRRDLGEIAQSPEELSSYLLLLIETDLGRLDVIRDVTPLGDHEQLNTVEMELVEGRVFKVISLDDLISVKESLPRTKDRAVEEELKALRDLRESEE